MKKILLLALYSFGILTLITGCGQNIPYVNEDTQEECATINKDMLKINDYIQTIEKTSAFHLEEASIAMLAPKITVSNNKRTILRDANKKKARLEAKYQKLGCEATTR